MNKYENILLVNFINFTYLHLMFMHVFMHVFSFMFVFLNVTLTYLFLFILCKLLIMLIIRRVLSDTLTSCLVSKILKAMSVCQRRHKPNSLFVEIEGDAVRFQHRFPPIVVSMPTSSFSSYKLINLHARRH